MRPLVFDERFHPGQDPAQWRPRGAALFKAPRTAGTRLWEKLNEIPGVSCVKPKGGLYAFARLDLEGHKVHDDEKFVLDFLLREKVQVVQGTGVNRPSHFRILTSHTRTSWTRRSAGSGGSSGSIGSSRPSIPRPARSR
jgi:aspartate/methionine/tyrosine aminotransferase